MVTSISKRNCQNCGFWCQDGEQEYQGHCGLYSCNCTTEVYNHETPSRWMSKEDIKPLKLPKVLVRKILIGMTSISSIKTELLMSAEELAKAKDNKQRYEVMYPDIRKLTDKSKTEMRKFKITLKRENREATS